MSRRPVSTHSRPKAAGAANLRAHGIKAVSTHSRPKAAGYLACADALPLDVVSTHSRPKAAGKATAVITTCATVSTHSRPKAAGDYVRQGLRQEPSFNTQPPEGGWVQSWQTFVHTWKFQHTAARRRLGVQRPRRAHPPPVSTHSRPKAAGANLIRQDKTLHLFQHTAARRRLVCCFRLTCQYPCVSTHSRPKAAGFSVRCCDGV